MDRIELHTKVVALRTRQDLLNLLNEIKAELADANVVPFTMRQMLILCNPNMGKHRYTVFHLPKKTGGKRVINAPKGNLKWMQLCLNEIFKALYTPSIHAMGFTTGKSIVDNAMLHTNQHYVFNIDLENFFPSIDQARVWKRLQLPPFNFPKEIANVVAGICAIKDEINSDKPRYCLPQGAPTSPLLTNAICDNLDRRLCGLARRFGLRYSRYADDITFSSMQNVYQENSEFRKELTRIINGQGFSINSKKTRLQHCSRRQEVTGLTVDKKVNVSSKYVKDIRALLHIWGKFGYQAAYARFYPKYKSEKGHLHKGEPNLENVLDGKLCYLKMVKGEADAVYIKLKSQFDKLVASTSPEPRLRNEWEFLFTCSMSDFESILKTSIQFNYKMPENFQRISDEKFKNKTTGEQCDIQRFTEYCKQLKTNPYGVFEYQGATFLVTISKHLNIEKLPLDVQISLCRVKDSNAPGGYKMMYLLHRSHVNGIDTSYLPPEQTPGESNSLEQIASELIAKFSQVEPTIENDNKQPYDEEILARFVENFDLSILP